MKACYFMGLMIVSVITNLQDRTYENPEHWIAIKTRFADHASDPISERNQRSQVVIDLITASFAEGHKVIILPESALGLRTPGLEPQLSLIQARAVRNDAIVMLGVIEEKNGTFENSLLILGKQTDAYHTRQPAPFIMWNPWKADHFKSHWWDKGVYSVHGKKVAFLICWEEWVPWPMLLSSFSKPDVIISASNHGWAKDDRMWRKQSLSANAISKLYGLPRIRAVNLAP